MQFLHKRSILTWCSHRRAYSFDWFPDCFTLERKLFSGSEHHFLQPHAILVVNIEIQKSIKNQFIETKKTKEETKAPQELHRNLSNTKVMTSKYEI